MNGTNLGPIWDYAGASIFRIDCGGAGCPFGVVVWLAVGSSLVCV